MIRRAAVAALISLLLAGCGVSSATPAPAAVTPPPVSAVPSATAVASQPVLSSPTATSGGPAAVGRAFIDALARGDTAAAEALEDATMRAAAPGAQLGQLWQQFEAQYGAYQGIGAVTTTVQGAFTIAAVPVTFANATLTLTVAVNAEGQVSGLHLGAVSSAAPGTGTPAPSPAAYVDPTAFTESEVTVGNAPWALPGTLSMPNGPGPFPAVLLVAGSGPQDRDETIGPNKPLRDLAWGLASAGIAVLRYDKRTFVYGAQIAQQSAVTITVREETTEDALIAISLLRSTPGVDQARVFLVGHSLGAYLAPRIAAQAPGQLRGIALLEAPSTPLQRLILAQAEYLASLQASPDPSAQSQLEVLRAKVALAESPTLSSSTPATDLPLNIPASYWLDLRTYDPLATAASLALPMFFSQGGRDYQVPPSELGPWKSALAGSREVTFRDYPAMDHVLVDGTGPATPAEYTVSAHVDAQLVADLAAWVGGLQGR
jgi:uncharacterized protein